MIGGQKPWAALETSLRAASDAGMKGILRLGSASLRSQNLRSE